MGMVLEKELEEDYMKEKRNMDNMNLKERLEGIFPIRLENIYVDKVNAEQLLEFKKNCKIYDNSEITCRPLVKRTDEETLALFNNMLMNENTFLLGIYEVDEENNRSDRIIGRISLYDFNIRNRSVEIGYYMDSNYRGKGIMNRAMREICFILINVAKINKVYAQTASFNRRSIGLLLSIGFKLDARLREHHELKGKLYDDYIFSIIASDF